MLMRRHVVAAQLALLGLACVGGCSMGSAESPSQREWRRKVAEARLEKATGKPNTSGVARTAAPASAPTTRPVRAARSGTVRTLLVNDEIVTVDDVLRPIRPQLEAAASRMGRDRYYETLRTLVMRQIVREVAERLVYKEASRDWNDDRRKQLGTVIDRVERDRINQDFDGRTPRYEAWLAREGITREDFRAYLGRTLVVREYLRERLMPRAAVNRRELFSYYQAHASDFRKPARVEMFLIDIPLRQILDERELNDVEKVAAARRVARRTLDEARARIASGEPFADVARQYSKGLNIENGGRWGIISEPLQGYWEHASRTALRLKAGEVSPVIEFEQGAYIVRAGTVESAETPSFEAAQGAIAERLRESRLSQLEGEFLQSMASKAALGDVEPFVQAIIAAAPEPPLRSSP